MPDEHLDQEPAAAQAARHATARVTGISIALNTLLAIAQVATGIVAASQGLVADGIHSISDILADAIVLIAARHSGKAADDDHPYGHHRYENAASLALGLLLLTVGIGMMGAAFAKLELPHAVARVQAPALWIAGFSLLAKEGLFRYMLMVASRIKSSLLAANAWHARADAASSLIVAVGICGNRLGYPLLDPIAALIVGLLIAKFGWQFGWRALQELMDRSADSLEVEAIRRTLVETPGVRDVHALRTRKMGDLIVVDAHLEVDAHLTVEAGHDISVAARQRVLQRHRVLDLMTHVDPFKRPDRDHGDDAGPRG